MIGENLGILRRQAGLSQEALADRLGVSRQTVAKWEAGESLPDVERCARLAEVFEITLDQLVQEDLSKGSTVQTGRYVFGTVTVGDKGQIVIPVKARRLFNIQPGDDLMVLGDIKQGLALVRADLFLEIAKQLEGGKG